MRCWLWLPTSILPVSLAHHLGTLPSIVNWLISVPGASCAFKVYFLVRFISFIPVFSRFLAVTKDTPVGCSLHQWNLIHPHIHLEKKHLTAPFQFGPMIGNMSDESVDFWRTGLCFKCPWVLVASLWMNECILTIVAVLGSFASATSLAWSFHF